jgi:hypothetical protein
VSGNSSASASIPASAPRLRSRSRQVRQTTDHCYYVRLRRYVTTIAT